MWNIFRRRGEGALDARLLKAAAEGDAAAVTDLLARGADPDARDPASGCTAAHFAAKIGATEILKALAARGADLGTASEDGNTPLDEAISTRRTSVVLVLFELGVRPVNAMLKNGYDPVYRAAHAGSAEIIRILRDRGCAVDKITSIYTKKKSHAVTPLHAAAMQGHVDCIRLLLELGVGVNRGGVPPLFWAVRYRHEDALRVLLDAGGFVTAEVVAEAKKPPRADALVESLEEAMRKNPAPFLMRAAMTARRWLIHF